MEREKLEQGSPRIMVLNWSVGRGENGNSIREPDAKM